MTITHHPSDETLGRFASGALGAGPSLVVETHLAGCRRCRDLVAQFTAVAAAMIRDLPPAAMADDALDRALAAIGRGAPMAMPEPVLPRQPRHWPEGSAVPAPLRSRDIGRWIWLGPRVRISRVAVPEDAGARVILLWVKPGTRLPEHGHSGTEYTQVLVGSYSDQFGRYGPGDLLEAGADLDHQPIVDAGRDCLCLAAVEGSAKMRGWLGHIVRPFVSA